MKRILSIIFIFLGSISIFAEETDTTMVAPAYESNWLFKGGWGFMNQTEYSDDINAIPDLQIAFAYQQQINSNGLYVGGTVGCNLILFGQYLEGNVGIKKPIGNNKVFDGHFGAGVRVFPIAGFYTRGQWDLGAGIWFKKFLVELNYMGSAGNGGGVLNHFYINFGVRF